MMLRALLPTLLLWPLTAQSIEEDVPVVSAEAKTIHRSGMLFDGHNDLPWVLRSNASFDFDLYDISGNLNRGHTDIPRLRAGGVKAQFWSVFVPSNYMDDGRAVTATLEQIDVVHRMIRRYPDTFELALTANDVERIVKKGKIASLIGMEGGHSIDNSLGTLRMMYRLGARYMTITHSTNLAWADAATDKAKHRGLTTFGKAVIQEMNRLGMLVDISHVSAKTMHDCLATTQAPVIASHSSSFHVAQHPRNVPDDVLLKVKENGGVIMVNFYSGFVNPEGARLGAERMQMYNTLRREYQDDKEFRKAWNEWKQGRSLPRATFKQVIDHIEHIAQVAGVEHVGIGGDYDGIDSTPIGLEDVSTYPRITQGLLDRGFEANEIRAILGGNVLRVMHEAEAVAAKLQKAGPEGLMQLKQNPN